MQIGKIEFGLPEERDSFYISVHAVDTMIAIHDALNEMRQIIKYGVDSTEDLKRGVEVAREILLSNLNTQGIDIEWLK